MNKVFLITGGSRGIGEALATHFSELNETVVYTCSRTEPYYCDVRYYDHVERMVNDIIKKEGKIDVLITCAGILGPMGRLEDSCITNWKDTIEVNLLGTVNCIHKILPSMKKQNYGRIVTFCGGGVGSNNIPVGFSAYNTSKYAIAGFTEAVSKELDAYDITINAISPGAIDTDMARSRFVKGNEPTKVIELVDFLVTTNKKINGKVISANRDDYRNTDYTKESMYTFRRVY